VSLSYSNEHWKYVKLKERNKINIMGFKDRKIEDPNDYFHCSLHKYARLLHVKNEHGIWQCPECGARYVESQLVHKTILQSKRSKGRKSFVASKKRERKLHSIAGDPINLEDKDIMRDIAEGRTIREYKEFTK